MNSFDTVDPVVADALASLQLLSPKDIPNLEDFCPICLMTFRNLLEPREDNLLGKTVLGVARVDGCGHLFCADDLSEWIKGRHGTCPTCRHEFLPELRPVDSEAESSDGGEYIPTEYDADSDLDTDHEDDFMDSDGIDVEVMDVEHSPSQSASSDEATEGIEDDIAESSFYNAESRDPQDQSVCGSEASWWDESFDGDGLTDGDSMSTSEGEISFGEQFSETNVQVRLGSDGEYAIYEDGTESKS